MFKPLLDCVPANLTLERDDDYSFVVTVPISESEDGYQQITLDVRLSPIGADRYEFDYAISSASIDGSGDVYSTHDREMAAAYIPLECRGLVLPTVCSALKHLVSVVQPQEIQRVTFTKASIEKAHVKHRLITIVLQDIGYEEVSSGTNAQGRLFV